MRARFLMWTYDGVHIMWGFCGNGRFTGTDNLGNHCWGIYGKGVFAGFYEGEFFWGRYSNGTWKAQGLFKPGKPTADISCFQQYFQPRKLKTSNRELPPSFFVAFFKVGLHVCMFSIEAFNTEKVFPLLADQNINGVY